MNKLSLKASLLAAGLVAAAGIHAQETWSVPQRAGEASTLVEGRPNARLDMPELNAPAEPRLVVPGVSSVPPKAGEASTIVHGRPNVHPEQLALARTRDDVRAELLHRRAMLEAARPHPAVIDHPVGVPHTLPPHWPSVFEGGTPE